MRVLVCGHRQFKNLNILFETLDFIHSSEGIDVIIHSGTGAKIRGDEAGADRLADQWARAAGIPCEVFAANWERYGNIAGLVRNRVMLKIGRPDLVVAFPGGRWVPDLVNVARSAGIGVLEIRGAKRSGRRRDDALRPL